MRLTRRPFATDQFPFGGTVIYGRLGDRSAHAMKTAQTIISPTAAGNGTSDVGIDTSTASFVIDPGGNSDIREPFRLVQSMQTKSMPRGIA
jgi:hypothetical protein